MSYDAIFIVGTGRSGTHYSCRCLLDFENVTDYMDGKEDPDLLRDITNLTIRGLPLSKNIIGHYKNKIDQSLFDGKVFLDQCHPNLYHYHQLSTEIDNCLFLGIERPIEQIVASMLNHKGVRGWYKKLTQGNFDDVKYPNTFFGLNSKQELYDLPIHILCAKRVISHKKTTRELSKYKNFGVINFENLVKNKLNELHSLFPGRMLERLGKYSEKETSSLSALTKFSDTLSIEQIRELKEEEEKFFG